MSTVARLALMDDRSVASKPGGVRVHCLRYAAHFPSWPVVLSTAFLCSVGCAATWPKLWAIPLVVLVLNLLYWVRVRLHFRMGCVNPAKVVGLAPFTLAVMTDLTTGAGRYPTLKLLRHPVPRGFKYDVGARCVTVATYTGKSDAEHWENFMPVMVECATSNRAIVEESLRSISAEDWAELDEALKKVPQPLKLGLYPL